MLSKLVTSLLCVAVFILIVDFNSSLSYEFRNQSWFVFHYCRLNAISREKVILNLNGTVLHPANNIKVHVKLLKKANGFKPWLLASFCAFKLDKFNYKLYNLYDLLTLMWMFDKKIQFDTNVTFVYAEDLINS
ncbi:uncharacterized protein Dere_GG26293 [Drosophila erecta]|uniref:Uncharacterized protein n=1 Tax=Drosophila erecta TaxID=7220 RepID=A0A0Q5U6M1_DROER|nr:uncharacterized protein Dere_GG26293 [Drosophila erecta]